jgi:hypothetical protein
MTTRTGKAYCAVLIPCTGGAPQRPLRRHQLNHWQAFPRTGGTAKMDAVSCSEWCFLAAMAAHDSQQQWAGDKLQDLLCER